jgi:hypothetical protein
MRSSLLLLSFLIAGLTAEFSNAQNYSSSPNGEANDSITILAEDYAFQAPDETSTAEQSTDVTLPDQGNLVEVTTTAMDFQVADEISSGWTTFRYYNNSPLAHFFSLSKLPVVDGKQKTAQDEADEAGDIYSAALDSINAGNPKEAFAILENLPAWASEKIQFGGVGMLSPGEIGQTDVYLEPGVYLMECYIKTGGAFHAVMGMYANIIVTDRNSGASPPEPTLKMNISTTNGFELDEDIAPGKHVLEVYFEDQVSENGSGHDVHLVKLSEDSDLEKLGNWMIWTTPEGMSTPAPEGTFLGGVQNLRAGERGYMTVDITPGRYAWISEGSNLASRDLIQTFEVDDE